MLLFIFFISHLLNPFYLLKLDLPSLNSWWWLLASPMPLRINIAFLISQNFPEEEYFSGHPFFVVLAWKQKLLSYSLGFSVSFTSSLWGTNIKDFKFKIKIIVEIQKVLKNRMKIKIQRLKHVTEKSEVLWKNLCVKQLHMLPPPLTS